MLDLNAYASIKMNFLLRMEEIRFIKNFAGAWGIKNGKKVGKNLAGDLNDFMKSKFGKNWGKILRSTTVNNTP
jgi:hypothetical protein